MMRYCYYLLKYSLAHIKRNCYMDEESVVDVTHGKNWVQIYMKYGKIKRLHQELLVFPPTSPFVG